MSTEKMIQKEIGSYISTLLRHYFGKGPTSVYVTAADCYITIHLRGFLSQTEKILLKQEETKRVLEIRNLLMKDLRPEIKLQLYKIGYFPVSEIYADWNMEDQTGLIFILLKEKTKQAALPWPAKVDKAAVYDEVMVFSEVAQKVPDSLKIHWLNSRTILMERSGIFMKIEEELIEAGYLEQLKQAKRPLEKKLLMQSALEELLQRKIEEIYFDWNFEEDKGYIILILEPEKAADYP